MGQARRFISAHLGAAALAAVCATTTAGAQEGELRLDEVVVTAQKREQRLQDVPFSVSAIPADQIEAAGIVRLDDAARYVPGLYFETIGLARPFIFIRGVGSGAFDAGSDPSVAVFVDEVYMARFTGIVFDLFDLERLEVLKGPQGTLFGRNTAGGAVNVVTKAPTPDFEAKFYTELGNYDSRLFRAGVSGPLGSDKLLYRLALASKDSKGYIENTLTGRRHQDDGSFGARGQLKFLPSDNFDAQLTLEYSNDDVGMLAQQNVTDNVLFRPPGDLASQPDGLSLEQQYTTDGYQKRDMWMGALHMNWDTAIGRLTSITSMRNNEFEELHDQDSWRLDTLDRYALENSDTFTQELRLANGSPDSRLDWVVGLYYLKEETTREEQWIIGANTAFALFMNGGQRFPLLDLMDVSTESYAVFGQATWKVNDRFNVTAGGRYSEDRKHADRHEDNFGVGTQCTPATPCGPFPANVLLPASFDVSMGRTWDSFDPVFTLDYEVRPDLMVYATYRAGFKSGGFQPTLPANPARASFIFDPENIQSYEIGMKSQFLDRRLQLNVALFDNSYEDLQFITGSGVGPGGVPIVVIDNAAQASGKGGEIDLVARPTDRFNIGVGYSYVDATLDEYVDDAGVSQAGKRVIRTPEHQANAVIEYFIPVGNAGEVGLRGEWSYRSRVFFDPANSMQTSQEGFDQYAARVSYTPGSERWTLAAYGRNLGDTLYCQNTVTLSAATVGTCATGAPRTYGISFSYHYR